MDGRTDEQADRWTDGWMEGRMNGFLSPDSTSDQSGMCGAWSPTTAAQVLPKHRVLPGMPGLCVSPAAANFTIRALCAAPGLRLALPAPQPHRHALGGLSLALPCGMAGLGLDAQMPFCEMPGTALGTSLSSRTQGCQGPHG